MKDKRGNPVTVAHLIAIEKQVKLVAQMAQMDVEVRSIYARIKEHPFDISLGKFGKLAPFLKPYFHNVTVKTTQQLLRGAQEKRLKTRERRGKCQPYKHVEDYNLASMLRLIIGTAPANRLYPLRNKEDAKFSNPYHAYIQKLWIGRSHKMVWIRIPKGRKGAENEN